MRRLVAGECKTLRRFGGDDRTVPLGLELPAPRPRGADEPAKRPTLTVVVDDDRELRLARERREAARGERKDAERALTEVTERCDVLARATDVVRTLEE